MSLYYPMTPVEELCPDCHGHGRLPPDSRCCPRCKAIGRVFVEGGPSFGCKLTLGGRKRGEVVTLGNGDRGRVIRHCSRGQPTTMVALIDELFDVEDPCPTTYPSIIGVRSTLPAMAVIDDNKGQKRALQDHMDPLQREMKAL